MTGKSIFLAAAACGLLLAAALPAAQAQSSPASAPARLVTRDEYRACLASGDSIHARQQDLEQRNKRAADDAAAMRTEAAELADEQKRLEEHPNLPRTRFERRVAAFNAKVPVEKERAGALKSDLEAFNAAVVAHNGQCARITVRDEDRDAVVKERESKAK
jgi:hypothetical protein